MLLESEPSIFKGLELKIIFNKSRVSRNACKWGGFIVHSFCIG